MHDAFESVQFLIRQTNADIERLKVILADWLAQGRYTPVVDVDAETGNKLHKLVYSHPIPEELRAIANNALNNLRHSFDQATSAVYLVVNQRELTGHNFPFCTNPNDLKGRLRADHFANFPNSVLDTIKRVQPYPTGPSYSGGNDLFSTFCAAAGRNKHRTTANLDGRIGVYRGRPGNRATDVISLRIPPVWDVAKGEMILGLTGPKGQIYSNFEITPEITFGNAEKLTGAPIYRSVSAIALIAEEVAREFKSALV